MMAKISYQKNKKDITGLRNMTEQGIHLIK